MQMISIYITSGTKLRLMVYYVWTVGIEPSWDWTPHVYYYDVDIGYSNDFKEYLWTILQLPIFLPINFGRDQRMDSVQGGNKYIGMYLMAL